MDKKCIYYNIIWILFVSFFNVACFISPSSWYGYDKFGGAFWAGYIFIMIALVLHWLFTMYMIYIKNKNQKNINTALTVISYSDLIWMFIAGTTCMLVPGIPNWIGIIVCYLLLIVSIVKLISTQIVGENAIAANDEVNNKTNNFRMLINDADALVNKSKDLDIKKCTKEIYDTIRYSDLVSSPELEEDEQKIKKMIEEINEIITDDSKKEEVKNRTQEIINAIKLRNNKCKMLKH